jgi:hypothetical protein
VARRSGLIRWSKLQSAPVMEKQPQGFLVLQPYLMKHSNRVPIWASILAPIVLGLIIPFS